jgi:gamma-glutamyltranspeptidase / glutathione hydrolase
VARLAALLLLVTLAGCEQHAPPVSHSRQPETERFAERFMVAAANPLAVDAGLAVLRRGGSAVDAAVAVQMTLGFVEAPETGIGGGGFMLYLSAAEGRLEFFDGRETAPAAAQPDRFEVLGWPAPRWFAIPSGHAVGVPGLVAMLDLAHDRHGRLPWSELLEPAIRLAEEGVPMPERMRRQARGDFGLAMFPDVRRAFVKPARDAEPRLRNAEYANTLRTLAAGGARAFYEGEISASLVERVRASRWAGDLSLEDMRNYIALERAPVCGRYREWTVCGAPPPSSGGIAVLQILGMVERFPLPALGPDSAQSIHVLVEAHRLAFADRARYVGDPAFVRVPVAGLLDPAYLLRRSLYIDPGLAIHQALPGAVEPGVEIAGRADSGDPPGGTSHFTIVDGDGNVVALTSSIEAPFGSRLMTGGFLLNNQLTDFSFISRIGAHLHPNAVAPGKRPRSSMSPVIVLDRQGNVRLAIGARGGPRIIGYVVKTLVAVLDWDLEIQEAIALPNFAHANGRLELERGTPLAARAAEFEALGHRVQAVPLPSGLHGIERAGDGWRGGADPRLDGVARGE